MFPISDWEFQLKTNGKLSKLEIQIIIENIEVLDMSFNVVIYRQFHFLVLDIKRP